MALAARFPRGFECFSHIKKFKAELRRELVTGCALSIYEQFETSPETIEQELRPAVCEHRQTDGLKENYSIDTVCLRNFAKFVVVTKK